MNPRPPTSSRTGMTFVEMVLCLFILSVLAGAAFPLVEKGERREKEIRLAEALRSMRGAIDRHYAERARAEPESSEGARYPRSLEELVEKRMLRAVPLDPMTGKTDWIRVSRTDGDPTAPDFSGNGRELFDVRSRSMDRDRRGRAYRIW